MFRKTMQNTPRINVIIFGVFCGLLLYSNSLAQRIEGTSKTGRLVNTVTTISFDAVDDQADQDADGIPNSIDGCSNETENFNFFEDDDGCPDTPDYFDFEFFLGIENPIRGSSLILPAMRAIKEDVIDYISQYPETHWVIRVSSQNSPETKAYLILQHIIQTYDLGDRFRIASDSHPIDKYELLLDVEKAKTMALEALKGKE